MATVTLTTQLRATLKRMWELDEVINRGIQLTREDTSFYNENLRLIRYYYEANSKHWNDKVKLNII